jgi:predicted amidohydrolase
VRYRHVCICNDRRWPETYRVLALQGAEVIVLGYNTPSHNIHWNEPMPTCAPTPTCCSLQASAHQNARLGGGRRKMWFSEDGHHMFGSSVIVSHRPARSWPGPLSEDDEVICARIDLDLGVRCSGSHMFDFARHRRPEHYRLIIERTGPGEPLP